MRFSSFRPRRLLAVLWLLTAGGVGASRAETVSVPPDGSGLTFETPAGWTLTRQGDGATLVSPDGTIHLTLSSQRAVGDAADTIRKEAHRGADTEGMNVTSEKADGSMTNKHGVRSDSYGIEGQAHGRPWISGAVLLTPPKGTTCLMSASINAADPAKFGRDMDALFQSMQPGGNAAAAPADGRFDPVTIPKATANVLQFPVDGSSVIVSLPPGWKAMAEGSNLRAQTNDGTLSVVFMPGKDLTDVHAQVRAMAQALADRTGVKDGKLEEHEQKSRADASVAVYSCALNGQRNGHETIAAVACIQPAKGDPCVVQTVIDTVAAKAHQSELEDLVEKIKPAK